MNTDLRDVSTSSIFRTNSVQSLDALKTDDRRAETKPTAPATPKGRLRAISRVSWSSVFRGMRAPNEQPSALDEFQLKLHLNSDIVVAMLELTIISLSAVQLEVSSRSPRWRENKVCQRLSNCEELEDEGFFIVPNCLRSAIGLLGLIRLWVRIRFLLKHREVVFAGASWLKRTSTWRKYAYEVIAITIFPYPGLESFLNRNQADVMVYLSVFVGFRSICWRHIMFFPYPIRQKNKVARFAGNLVFSYREFVFKKVMDDHPLRKIILVTAILLVSATFLVRAIETINCVCTPFAEVAGQAVIHARDLDCVAMSWGDAMWLVSTSFLSLGYGDVVPHSKAGRSVIVVYSFLMRIVSAMLASVVIKKSYFSTMEARVHAFLFRMDLFNKKDLGAVLAVQASFRFAKSYKRSLKWHKHRNSLLYYRPLSARLPDEVKKKLYVSRFQASLKDIMKFNTDGDPLNAFVKHIEVITAALGITLVEMAQLKKLYRHKSRLLNAKHKRAAADHSAMALLAPESVPSTPRPSMCNVPMSFTPSSTAAVPAEWGQSMVTRCEQVLADLYRLEQSAKTTFRQ